MKRHLILLLCAALLIASCACGGKPATDAGTSCEDRKEASSMSLIPEEKLRALCDKIDGRYELYVSVPAEGEVFSVNAEKQFYSASTIKVPILARLLQDAEEGRLDLDQPIPLSPENRVGGSGVLVSLDPSVQLSLFDYAVLMMAISDNSATNQVIDAVGLDRTEEFIRAHDWPATHIGRKMLQRGAERHDGTREQNYTSAADLGHILEAIADGKLVSRQVSDTMMQIMATQRNGRLRPGIPECVDTIDPHRPVIQPPPGKVFFAAKGGSGTYPEGKVANDAGILIFPGGRRAVVVLLTISADVKATEAIMRDVAHTVYEALS